MNKHLWQIFHDQATEYGMQRLQYKLRSVYQIDLSLSQLYRYGEDPGTTGTDMPPTLYIPVTLITGNDSILRHYVEPCNKIIIDLPACNIKSAKNITREIAKTLKECAEVIESSSKAIIDGKLNKSEKLDIDNEIAGAQAQLARLKEVIKHG